MASEEKRPRVTFDCPERLRRAIWYRAVSMGANSPTAVIVPVLEEALKDELALADKSLAKGDPPVRSKRGRKPKPKSP